MTKSATRVVNVHEAKTHLSRLLDEVEAGADIVIARAGTPVALLVGIEPEPRRLGAMAGVWPAIPDSFFFDPLPEDELAAWEA